MHAPIRLEYRAKPSALSFVRNAFGPARRAPSNVPLPDIQARWSATRSTPRDIADFLRLSGLPEGEHVSILYPHTLSFPMQMAVLSHPVFPFPVWNILQIRNRLVQHEPIAPDAALKLTVCTGERRVMEKGVEMDLQVSAESRDRPVWEAVNTFYARGRFGPAQSDSSPSPDVSGTVAAEWRMPEQGRWRYGRLSGDFNPLHISNGYARRFGYLRAFTHPQRAIGQCLGHLAADHGVPMTLDTWIKG
ncbi:MAG: hypothetical protein K9J74_05175, partial [Sulfuritalea sp.]|nr:hypothetical protein [Sulfuritalea sp.]